MELKLRLTQIYDASVEQSHDESSFAHRTIIWFTSPGL